jgi:hypothetical protein
VVIVMEKYPISCVLSFKPLVDYLEKTESSSGSTKKRLFDELKAAIDDVPELLGPIEDLTLLEKHGDIVKNLMESVFPKAYWNNEIVAAVLPYTMKPILASPLFKQMLLDNKGAYIGRRNIDEKDFDKGKAIRAYLFILEKFYGIAHKFEYPLLYIVEDPETGLDRYLQIRFDYRFADVYAVKEPKKLTDDERSRIQRHITDPDVLKTIICPENFEIRGFTVFHCVDVTEFEILSQIERDLIGHESIVSHSIFHRLQENLRVLFRRRHLVVDLDAVKGNRLLQISQGCKNEECCIFTNSEHIPLSSCSGTVFEEAICGKDIVMVPDIRKEDSFHHGKDDPEGLNSGSLLIAPLHYEDDCIGLLRLRSPVTGDLGPMEVLLLNHILPFFTIAVKKALDELDHRVQVIIKERCTAIHPTVEWRFREAALRHLEDLRMGHVSDIEPIIFNTVYPLYGASDIQGSTNERNRAIRNDLADHLGLALNIVKQAAESKPMMIFRELAMQIDQHHTRIKQGVSTGDEVEIVKFLRDDVEVIFPLIRRYGLKVSHAIEKYESKMDPKTGTVYELRRDFDNSMTRLNERLSAYLDQEEAAAQEIFPHFFERHQTDGVDYLIYLGDSLVEAAEFDMLYLKDFHLWQLKVACGMAWHTEQLKSELKMPLDTTHLVLIQNTPISIRFRYEEKRFDVDGTYDIRQEIIKSRIEKATIKNSRERLTQPGKIAIVYSHLEEAWEARRHIEFLKSEGYIKDEMETLDLEELPGVQGLKAFRVNVDLDSSALSKNSPVIASGGNRNISNVITA